MGGSQGSWDSALEDINRALAYTRDTRLVQAREECISRIHARDYQQALNILSNCTQKTARWYYLSALAQAGLHNNAQAMEYARQAVSMEPGNMQYQQLLSQLQGGGSWYGQRGTSYGRQTYGQPNLCCTFLLLQMLCSCCSGGRMFFYPWFCCC